MSAKYVFVTGGVVSSLGKGITAASLGRLLKARGYKISMQKCDPYYNVDPGLLSPLQHGEAFITDDGVAADLEYRLCQSFPASRSELRHPGGFGVEDRRAAADQSYRQQDGYEARGDGEGEQPEQREAHPRGERVGARMAVCIESDEGLQQRRGHLENQRDDSDLGEREAEFLLQERVDGRDHRLHHVVQQVGDADHEQYRVDCSGLREAPQACVRGFCKRLHCCGLWFFEYPRDRLPGIPHVPGKDVSE